MPMTTYNLHIYYVLCNAEVCALTLVFCSSPIIFSFLLLLFLPSFLDFFLLCPSHCPSFLNSSTLYWVCHWLWLSQYRNCYQIYSVTVDLLPDLQWTCYQIYSGLVTRFTVDLLPDLQWNCYQIYSGIVTRFTVELLPDLQWNCYQIYSGLVTRFTVTRKDLFQWFICLFPSFMYQSCLHTSFKLHI